MISILCTNVFFTIESVELFASPGELLKEAKSFLEDGLVAPQIIKAQNVFGSKVDEGGSNVRFPAI